MGEETKPYPLTTRKGSNMRLPKWLRSLLTRQAKETAYEHNVHAVTEAMEQELRRRERARKENYRVEEAVERSRRAATGGSYARASRDGYLGDDPQDVGTAIFTTAPVWSVTSEGSQETSRSPEISSDRTDSLGTWGNSPSSYEPSGGYNAPSHDNGPSHDSGGYSSSDY